MKDAIVYKPVRDLAEHPILRSQPALSREDPTFLALVEDIREHGVLQPLLINAELEIIDGRHRYRAAKRAGLIEVPCIEHDGADVESYILGTILHRRHYTKSALAFLALPLIEHAIQEGRAKVSGPRKRQPANSEGFFSQGPPSPAEAMAEKLGIGRSLLLQANRVNQEFEENEELREEWLGKFTAFEVSWRNWQDLQGADTSWEGWWADQSQALMRNLTRDQRALLLANPRPQDLRARYEPQLFSGEMSLGAIIQSLAGQSYKGGKRPDLTPEDPVQIARVAKNKIKCWDQPFSQWQQLDMELRTECTKELAKVAADWPEDVRVALYNAIAGTLDEKIKSL